MANYKAKFVVKPQARIKLSEYDPGSRGKHESHKAATSEIEAHLKDLGRLQFMMYAEHKHSLVIVLQGLDGAGKDGVIRHVLTGMNPQGCTVKGFKQPTPEELDHDFLWRIHPHAPAKGSVAIFNRSHYEDVLVARVHATEPAADWSSRYELINGFERLLALENHTTVLKFFLHISREEQLDRFKQRLDDPARNWKISEADYKEREYWDDYTRAYEELLRYTSTEHAPWYIIPSDHKWFRNLAISQIIVASLEALGMRAPVPTIDLKEIRRKYHAAAKEAKTTKKKSG